MKKLHNTIDKRILRQRMLEENVERTTISFYKYHSISEPQLFRDALYAAWSEIGVLGRTYIATEGINAQISIPSSQFNTFVEQLYAIPFLNGVRLNTAVEHGKSFFALKVKMRNKIVADGIDDPTFNPSNTGKYLTAEEWNEKMSDPNTVVVDMRNHYESEVGHFQGALMPDVDTFREELKVVEEILEKDKDKNVLMYCTGGIRCEKASAYFKHKGFENVYQLEGGIIEYTRQVKAEGLQSKFIGKNFVFDQRLGERITDDIVSQCHQCGKPCDNHTNCENEGCHLLFIQCDECKADMENCCSAECQEIIHMPLVEQVKLRRGVKNGNKIFRKGKSDKLLFKHSGELSDTPLANAKTVANPEASGELSGTKAIAIRQKIKVKKVLIGKAEHYYVKVGVGLFSIENQEVTIGDKILISGPTTGNQEIIVEKMFVNGSENILAKVGDKVTMPLPFRIRLSDKLYKIIS